MSAANDFWGDSETAVKECSYCGGKGGDLVPSIYDTNGPTHWHHVKCHEANKAIERTGYNFPTEWESRGSKTGE